MKLRTSTNNQRNRNDKQAQGTIRHEIFNTFNPPLIILNDPCEKFSLCTYEMACFIEHDERLMAPNGCPLNVLCNEPAQFAPNETLLCFPCDAGTIAQGALSLPPPPRVQQGVLVLRAPTVRRGPSSPCCASLAPTPPPRTPLGASAVCRAGTAFPALFTCVLQVCCKQQQQTTKQQQPSNQFAFFVPIY